MAATEGNVVVTCPPCMVCGERAEVTMTADQFGRWQAGAPIQQVLPGMPDAMREQLISGTHPACWTELYGKGPAR